jgi:GNAT superfamily N-acetyltransferase
MRKEPEHKPCSVYEKIRVEEGSSEDYGKLCRFHYRSVGERKSGLRAKAVFRLMIGDSLIGVIVYSYSYLDLKPRNMVFGDRYLYTSGDLHKARLINEEIARISRVVIHPKFRGIGLGEYLVRETLPIAGVRVVEALAVMAKYNPFFERAGMVKVEYRRKGNELTSKIRKLLEARGFDFSLAGSKTYCCQVFNTLGEGEKQELMAYLTEFANKPFMNVQTVEPSLLARVFSQSGAYLYWMSNSFS